MCKQQKEKKKRHNKTKKIKSFVNILIEPFNLLQFPYVCWCFVYVCMYVCLYVWYSFKCILNVWWLYLYSSYFILFCFYVCMNDIFKYIINCLFILNIFIWINFLFYFLIFFFTKYNNKCIITNAWDIFSFYFCFFLFCF